MELQINHTNPKSSSSDSNSKPPKYFLASNELASLFGISPQAASMWMKHHKIDTFRFTNKSALTPESARSFLEKRGYTYPSEDIAFLALKGGSGKTASAFNLAVRLNSYGAKVLCIDLDMQGNLTDAFGLDLDEADPVFIDIVEGNVKIHEVIKHINPGLDLIPSSFNNSALDYGVTQKPTNLQTFIKDLLAPIRKHYDYVIIDCSPALNTINTSVALGADRVIIPINPEKFSKKGLIRSIKEFDRLDAAFKTKINYQLLFTLYESRESSSSKYLLDYGAEYRDRMLSTLIHRSAEVKNTIDRQQCIFDSKKASARDDFDQLTREVMGLSKFTAEKEVLNG
ncbi:MAG: AAA family ATPase [Bdellovibrionia bacterium]